MQKKCIIVLLYFLVSQAWVPTFLGMTAVIEEQELLDLQIFPQSGSEQTSLVDVLISPITKSGNTALADFLKNPVTDIELIQKRQNLIKQLAADEKLRLALQIKLQAGRWGLLAPSAIAGPLTEKVTEQLYFHDQLLSHYFPNLIKTLNTSPLALNLKHYFPGDIVSSALDILVFHLAINYVQKWLQSPPPKKEHNHNHHHEHKRSHHDHPPGHNCGACNLKTKPTDSRWIKLLFSSISTAHFVVHATSMWEGVHHSLDRRAQLQELYKILYKYRVSIDNMVNIFDLLDQVDLPEDYDDEREILDYISDILPTRAQFTSKELSWFSDVGQVLISYRALLQEVDQLDEVALKIGEIDVYVALAERMSDQSPQNGWWTYSEISSDPREGLAAQQLWNPILDPSKAIATDVRWPLKNKIILSGPNKAGKSVFMRAIGVNTLLSQCFGIAAAKSFKFYPVDRILTYMKVHEDSNKGHSMFVAEMARAEKFLQFAKENPDSHALMLVDDSLYRSTKPEKAKVLSQEFVAELALTNSAHIMIATHLDELIEVGTKEDSGFVNWHMHIYSNEQNQKQSSYQVKSGHSLMHDSFVLLE